jgi:glycosyltransferase involved in cell wall biosynthesis
VVLIAARDEASRLDATIAALRGALPGAELWVADDGSSDGTAAVAAAAGARVAGAGRALGKGGTMTLAARSALAELDSRAPGEEPVFLLCDGDLGASAAELGALVDLVGSGSVDVAIGAFARSSGGGFGIALAFARWALRRRCGMRARAPISGQRALRARALRQVLPFARGYGMELGMSIDAVRGGLRVQELELELSHRVSGRTAAGFAHRGRQLADFVRVYVDRR